MDKDLIEMSEKELDRVSVIGQAAAGKLLQKVAAQRLGLQVRQVKNLVRRYREQGPKGLASRRRGRRSNYAIDDAQRRRALEFLRDGRADFGPTLACEHAQQHLGVKVSRETMRKWMIEDGLRKARRRRAPRIHPPRERRPQSGELVQVDGSPHPWFEDRGPSCTLLLFVDDATSRIMLARFAEAETTAAYMGLLREYLETHGRPGCLYTDRHGAFRVNSRGREGKRTQFGRACAQLGIGLIHARTAPAKGRVERSFRTLQNRLVKEMRVLEIDGMEAANVYLPEFVAQYNAKFGKAPAHDGDAHRPALHSAEELDLIFAHQEVRTLSKNLTFQFRNRLYHVPPANNGIGYRMRRAKVLVCAPYGGEVSVI